MHYVEYNIYFSSSGWCDVMSILAKNAFDFGL